MPSNPLSAVLSLPRFQLMTTKKINTKRICVVTGSRAEFGQLEPLLRQLQKINSFELVLAATGTHLSKLHGMTYQQIEAAGFQIAAKVDLDLTDDSPRAISGSMGLALKGFGEVFENLKPDLVVVLGDRYEILAVTQAALVAKIPIAHIGGGDSTEGAFDESIRHSITKMSNLHFVTNALAAKRVKQLGENPKSVFNVGSLAIDQIQAQKLLSRVELERELGVRFQKRNFLVTYHPETLGSGSLFEGVLSALEKLMDGNTALFFTHPNADPAGRMVLGQIQAFVRSQSQAYEFASLGSQRYLSLMAQVDAAIGNSSSGLYEAPTLGTPTVNIGDRQKGRLLAKSVVCCDHGQAAVLAAVKKALKIRRKSVKNPYGNGGTAAKIVKILKSSLSKPIPLQKHFYDLK